MNIEYIIAPDLVVLKTSLYNNTTYSHIHLNTNMAINGCMMLPHAYKYICVVLCISIMEFTMEIRRRMVMAGSDGVVYKEDV